MFAYLATNYTYCEMKHFLNNLRPGDYLRDLSIVILGVAVTFIGSALITRHTVNKDIRENMRLIKIELDKNVMKVHEIMDYIAEDVRIGREVLSQDYRMLPQDTLAAYASAVSRVQIFSYTQDALEILKASSLMPDVKDKQLLLNIFRCYEAFGNVVAAVEFYNNRKQWALTYNDDKDYIVMRDGNVYDRWELYMNSDYMCDFLSNNHDIVARSDFDAMLEEIQKVIDAIAETYGITESGDAGGTADVGLRKRVHPADASEQ